MGSSATDDIWGPTCHLVRIFTDLRSETVQSNLPVGIGKIYGLISRWAQDSAQQDEIQHLAKNRIEQLLAGQGRLPNWGETLTLARALKHFAAKGFYEQDLDDTSLRTAFASTHLDLPRERVIAEHFGRRVFDWGQQNVVERVSRTLENKDRRSSLLADARQDIKDSRAALRSNQRQPSQVVEGAVAVSHTDPVPPACYQDVFDQDKLEEIEDLFELSGLIRPGSHHTSVTVERLETGVRVVVQIYEFISYIKAFVVMEALSSGSVAVYFRWIPLESDEQQRNERLLKWGLRGAARLCLHTHKILGASGTTHAYIGVPMQGAKPVNASLIPRIPLPESDSLSSIANSVSTHFGHWFDAHAVE